MNGKTSTVNETTVLYRRFSNPIINLSGDTKWYDMCHSIESKFVLDNYLHLDYDEMKKVFPQLANCNREEIKFRLLVDTCKNNQLRLSSWAFEHLVTYFEDNKDFIINNALDFQYKDYINLYKISTKNIVGKTHKKKLYNGTKIFIKKIFGLN